jgi:aspartokinase-like uncharacterized kinase
LSTIETVVKLGGGVLAHADHFKTTLAVISRAAQEHRLLVVPGGGPFADAVREVDRRHGLSDTAAHWMAVLAMDQYAHLIAERLAGGVIVADPPEIRAALGAARAPVLAPSRWLQEADPLPHSWDVTGDSIAAWVAGRVGARSLVLIKPPGGTTRPIVDAYFTEALPADVTAVTIHADQADALQSALGGFTRRSERLGQIR